MDAYLFPRPLLLEVSGKDSPRYMNARLTNNIAALPAGEGLFAGALTAQGRAEAFFAVLRRGESSFYLIADGGEGAATLAAFKRFIVADRVEVKDVSSEHRLLHVYSPEAEAHFSGLPDAELSFAAVPGGSAMKRTRGAHGGYDFLLSPESLRHILETMKPRLLDAEAYNARRLRAGIYSFPEEINDEILFSELCDPSWVSFNKGCYVGQEVMEKVAAIGKLSRRVQILSFPGKVPAARGDVVLLPQEGNRIIGEILSSAFDAEHDCTIACATLKNIPGIESQPVLLNTCAGSIVHPRVNG